MAPQIKRAAPLYQGAAGMRERWYVAILDREHRVAEKLSPDFGSRLEAVPAWLRMRRRRGRLVRELTLVVVEG